MTVIGLDIGHAETAACIALVGDRREPQPIELVPGQKSIPTAVATSADGSIIIGGAAIVAPHVKELALAFKSTDMRSSGDAIERFTRGIKLRVAEIGIAADAEFVVGVPSAWEKLTRVEYEAVLKRAGLGKFRLIAESRAALLSAGVSYEDARADVLVIDIGSSTTDVTFLRNLALEAGGPNEMGHNRLGGGLIDEALLAVMLERSSQREVISGVLAEDQSAGARALFAVRKTKEEYFSNEAVYLDYPLVRSHYVSVKPRVLLDIEVDSGLMEDLMSQPITFSHLENAARGKSNSLSWMQAYRELLTSAKSDPLIADPKTVVLTGSASRMSFVQSVTKQIFSRSNILIGGEPELAIAKGLAQAGRIDVQTAAFVEDSERVFNSEMIEQAVRPRYRDWQRAVAAIYVNGLTNVITNSLKEWRDSPDSQLTLRDIQKDAAEKFDLWFGLPETQRLVAQTFVIWSSRIIDDLRPEIMALMERNQIPIAQVDFNPITPLATSLDDNLDLLFKGTIDATQPAMRVVSSALAGAIGLGVDLHLFFATGGLFGVLGAVLGAAFGDRLPRELFITTPLKKIIPKIVLTTSLSDALITSLVRKQEATLAANFEKQLNDAGNRTRIERSIEQAVRKALAEISTKARLAIVGA
jgi:hypothetical protein